MKIRYNDKVRMGRNDPIFDTELDEIIRARFSNGLDKRPVGRAVVQRKIVRTPFWVNIKNDLKRLPFIPEDRIQNRKGQLGIGPMNPTFNLFMIAIVAFLAVVFFAGIMYAMSIVNSTMHQIPDLAIMNSQTGNITYVNTTEAADMTFGMAYSAMDGLRLVSMAMIFAMILGTLVLNFFVRTHPFLWIVHIFITVLAIIFSVPVSNAYQNLLVNGDILSSWLQMHSVANYLLIHLPLFICIIGCLGGVLMFINVMRSGTETPL